MTNKNTSSKKSQTHPKQHRIPLLKRPWFIGAIILAIVAIITGLIICFSRSHKEDDSANDDKITSVESNNQPNNNEDKPASSEPSDEEERPEDKVVQFEGEDPKKLEEITGVVSYRNVENGKLIIDTNIDQYLTSGGTCTVTIKGQNTGHSDTMTKAAHADIATSYCETFEIPAQGLPSDYYEIKIVITSDDKKGIIKDGVQL